MRVAIPLLLALSLACESDADKYKRLQSALYNAQLTVSIDEDRRSKGEAVCPEFAKLPTNAYMDACVKVVVQHQTDLALAQRDFNRFMSK